MIKHLEVAERFRWKAEAIPLDVASGAAARARTVKMTPPHEENCVIAAMVGKAGHNPMVPIPPGSKQLLMAEARGR